MGLSTCRVRFFRVEESLYTGYSAYSVMELDSQDGYETSSQ